MSPGLCPIFTVANRIASQDPSVDVWCLGPGCAWYGKQKDLSACELVWIADNLAGIGKLLATRVLGRTEA